MKRPRHSLLGLIIYLLLLGFLLDFNWIKILRPIPFISVLLGILILTLSQYRKGLTREEVLLSARWNAFFSGLLTSLLSMLSLFSAENIGTVIMNQLVERFIPLIYGSILYIIIDLLLVNFRDDPQNTDEIQPMEKQDFLNPQIANVILRDKGFSPRECHIALKLLEGVSNKEIAGQLFISEATVKKHIQNMFKKCNATDRHNFLILYLQWSKENKYHQSY